MIRENTQFDDDHDNLTRTPTSQVREKTPDTPGRSRPPLANTVRTSGAASETTRSCPCRAEIL
jgi:hypothetical protein